MWSPWTQRADCTYLILFIHSSLSGRLDSSQSWATEYVSSATVSMGVLIFLWVWNFKTAMRYHITHVSMAMIKNTKMRMWRNGNCFTLLVGMQNCAATVKKDLGVTQKVKNKTTIGLSNPTSWCLPITHLNLIWINNQGYWHIERLRIIKRITIHHRIVNKSILKIYNLVSWIFIKTT